VTHDDLVRRMVKKSGYPERVVRHLLQAQIEVLKDALIAQEKIVFRTLFHVHTQERVMSVAAPGKPRRKVKRLVLYVRPYASFRKLLNQWGSEVDDG
jgi:nucleoid DNA-binding protein